VQVLETLKSFNIKNIEELTLMEDTQVEGVNRGYAFIEFGTHEDALEAFRKLQQPDAIFGTDRSAKVAWAQPLYEPDEDTMSQVSYLHNSFMIFSYLLLVGFQ
jgi:RNA recognition motif-containing protein